MVHPILRARSTMEVKDDPEPYFVGPLDQPLQVVPTSIWIFHRWLWKWIVRPGLEHPEADRNPQMANSGSGKLDQILSLVKFVPMPDTKLFSPLVNCFFKRAYPSLFLFIFVLFTSNITENTVGVTGIRTRIVRKKRACWPLDHDHGPSFYKLFPSIFINLAIHFGD